MTMESPKKPPLESFSQQKHLKWLEGKYISAASSSYIAYSMISFYLPSFINHTPITSESAAIQFAETAVTATGLVLVLNIVRKLLEKKQA